MNETRIAALDWVAHCHAQRLARSKSYGRRDGLKSKTPATCADLLAEWTGWRKRKTFGDELDTWLTDFSLDADERRELIEWIQPQPLPIDQLETILTDAGLNLKNLAMALGAVLTYTFLQTGELPAVGHAVAATLIGAGAEGIDDGLWSVVATWTDFRADVFLSAARRAA